MRTNIIPVRSAVTNEKLKTQNKIFLSTHLHGGVWYSST